MSETKKPKTGDDAQVAEKILEEARAEAAAIVAAAKEQAAEELEKAKQAAEEQAAAEAAKKPDTVRVRLFKDSDKYKGDVFVAVNGNAIKIQRGVDVDLPVAHFEVLERSMTQDAATATLIEKESAAYERAKQELN